MAIRVDEELKYPFEVDVYSFGMVCFEILTGDLPFPTLSAYEGKKKVLEGARPQLPDQCPEKLRHLIEACWSSEPHQRPRFDHMCAELRHLKCTSIIISAWANEKDRSNNSGHVTRFFSYEELDHATQGFSAKPMLGHGGLATLYKGTLADGRVVVVRLPGELKGTQSIPQFLNKVEGISKMRDPRRRIPVQLLGCCIELSLLVYEYIKGRRIEMYLLLDI